MFQRVPEFWKSDLDTIERMARESGATQLCLSAGGRPIWLFEFGERQKIISHANYCSALNVNDLKAYIENDCKKPVILLVGAIHGQETEGVAALLNLISLLQTGKDFAGHPNDSLVEATRQVRLLVIPVANPDGRARVVPVSMVGCKKEDLEYWGQGTWKDGSLCGWPDCKKVHPIKDAAGFLGGYFNDDGVNMMCDNCFSPMARETLALLKLAADEFSDYVVLLHGGTNDMNSLKPTSAVPQSVNLEICELAKICDDEAKKEGLRFKEVPEQESPAFTLTSGLHHTCGAVSMVFESNECVTDVDWGVKYTHEQIYRSHMILFEQLFTRALETASLLRT